MLMVVSAKTLLSGRRLRSPQPSAARDLDPQNVIGSGVMIVAGCLRRLPEEPHRGGLPANIGQRQCDAEFHRVLPNKDS
jgi:hypothetical protein